MSGSLAVGVFSDRVLAPSGGLVDEEALDAALEALDFTGAFGSVVTIPLFGGYDRLYAVGLGVEVDAELLRQAAGSLGATAKGEVSTTLHLVDVEGALTSVAQGFALGAYQYNRYKTADDKPAPVLSFAGEASADELAAAQTVVEQQLWARDLVNETPADQSPEALADRMVEIAKELGVSVSIMGNAELEAGGFGGLVGVNAGSDREARMVELTYTPETYSKTLAIVGKGIVFDSGGLSLKSPVSMMAMKNDMAGAAAVLAAFRAIAELKLDVRVIAITPLTENLPSGSATRPGDVLTIRNGKTIEVLNTDAEGRLVLADALSLAVEREPDMIVDLATLTGHCHVALGDFFAGAFGRDEIAMAAVLAAGEQAGERLWRLPMPQDHRTMIDSDIADMKNTLTGTKYGGHIAAALLLAEFTGDVPWVHLDIAGPAWSTAVSGYIRKGGTGFGVRTIVELAKDLSSGS